MKNPFENDRKHQNEIQDRKDGIFYLYVALFLGLFAGCVGAVVNAVVG